MKNYILKIIVGVLCLYGSFSVGAENPHLIPVFVPPASSFPPISKLNHEYKPLPFATNLLRTDIEILGISDYTTNIPTLGAGTSWENRQEDNLGYATIDFTVSVMVPVNIDPKDLIAYLPKNLNVKDYVEKNVPIKVIIARKNSNRNEVISQEKKKLSVQFSIVTVNGFFGPSTYTLDIEIMKEAPKGLSRGTTFETLKVNVDLPKKAIAYSKFPNYKLSNDSLAIEYSRASNDIETQMKFADNLPLKEQISYYLTHLYQNSNSVDYLAVSGIELGISAERLLALKLFETEPTQQDLLALSDYFSKVDLFLKNQISAKKLTDKNLQLTRISSIAAGLGTLTGFFLMIHGHSVDNSNIENIGTVMNASFFGLQIVNSRISSKLEALAKKIPEAKLLSVLKNIYAPLAKLRSLTKLQANPTPEAPRCDKAF